jgi:hypothetical protein
VIQTFQGEIRPFEENMGRFVDAKSLAEIIGVSKMNK